MKKIILLLSISILAVKAFSQTLTVDEIVDKHIIAIGGEDNWKKIHSMVTELSMDNPDIPLKVKYTIDEKKGARQDFYVNGQNGYNVASTNGAWQFLPFKGDVEVVSMSEDQASLLREAMDMEGCLVNYKNKGHKATLNGEAMIEGKKCYKIDVVTKNGNSFTFFVDADSFLIKKKAYFVSSMGQELETTYLEYKKLPEGITVPNSFVITNMNNAFVVDSIAVNVAIADSLFVSQQ